MSRTEAGPLVPLTALVPMRHQSERVPGKNFRDLAGKPLYHWIIETLMKSGWIEQIVIDTDSPVIKQDASACFPDVVVLDRPPHLRDGGVAMNDVLLHDIDVVGADWYVQTHSTNPLLSQVTLDRAFASFFSRSDEYDSMFSVTRLQTRLWSSQGEPLNHDPTVLLRTQDLPPVYVENSCFYVFAPETLTARRNRIGDRPLMVEIPAEEAWDIDEEVDFSVAEFLARGRSDTRGR